MILYYILKTHINICAIAILTVTLHAFLSSSRFEPLLPIMKHIRLKRQHWADAALQQPLRQHETRQLLSGFSLSKSKKKKAERISPARRLARISILVLLSAKVMDESGRCVADRA